VEQPLASLNAGELVVSLCIRHPSIDPQEISDTLGLAAEHCFRAGERRRTDEGEPLQGRYHESYWMGRFRAARPRLLGPAGAEAVLAQAALGVNSTEAELTQILLRLQRSQSFLARLQDEGASIELRLEQTLDGGELAFSLSPRLLALLTRCGVSLALEVRSEPCPAARRLAG
jgi:hypothetical protein